MENYKYQAVRTVQNKLKNDTNRRHHDWSTHENCRCKW